METTDETFHEGADFDYRKQNNGRITPFSLFCKTMLGVPPDRVPIEKLKGIRNDWINMDDTYKEYYINQANKKCRCFWQDENIKDFPVNKQKSKNYRKFGKSEGITSSATARKTEFELAMDQLIAKADCSLLLTAKSSPYDLGRWEHLPLGIPPKF